jgi:hypothetical protein
VVTVVVAVLVAVALPVGVVAVVAVDAANVDGDVPVVDLVVPTFAAAVAAVERYHQRQHYWLHERKRACRSRACLFVCDGKFLEPRIQALTASERLGLAPRRVLFPVCDFCGEELTIGSRLAQRCSRTLYVFDLFSTLCVVYCVSSGQLLLRYNHFEWLGGTGLRFVSAMLLSLSWSS